MRSTQRNMIVAVVAVVFLLTATKAEIPDFYKDEDSEEKEMSDFITEAQMQEWQYNRPPGKLLLNMLIKNEQDHLARTLPKWAKLIDYWIVGVDDHNTDDSEAVINRELGHLPGAIVVVEFDGMGPTWTKLVKYGIEHFPEATHGIIADADYMPLNDKLDKRELDMRCSKHMFTILTQDHTNERRMDWIYRNIPGAEVLRRTHQTVKVPRFPNQEVYQTLTSLRIQESPGGYGDRAGNKEMKYIHWLHKDLLDYPNDTRTLYYIGYAHLDLFMKGWPNDLKPTHWANLTEAVSFFKRRAELRGNKEEKWFAMIKLAEIHERFYQDWPTALHWYTKCKDMDEVRADPWFYIGQHFRLTGEWDQSIEYLYNAAILPMPDRALFQWHSLYDCLAKLELARAIKGKLAEGGHISKARLREYKPLVQSARSGCGAEHRVELGEVLDHMSFVKNQRGKQAAAMATPAIKPMAASVLPALTSFLNFVTDKLDILEATLGQAPRMKYYLRPLTELFEAMAAVLDIKVPTCRQYRKSVTPYLRFFDERKQRMAGILKNHEQFFTEWDESTEDLRNVCY